MVNSFVYCVETCWRTAGEPVNKNGQLYEHSHVEQCDNAAIEYADTVLFLTELPQTS